MPTTADAPKCYAEVAGKRLLDWALEAFHENDLRDVCFIGGYRIERVQEDYPEFTFRHNADWENNNILESLMCAEDLMTDSFLCCYSDILFTPQIVAKLKNARSDLRLGVDTEWLTRYEHRTDHPPDDAEKVIVSNGRVERVHREIPADAAYGEYIGVAAFSEAGADRLRRAYRRVREEFAGRPWREAKVFEKAYLILLFQEMIEAGESFAHVDTPGGYIEVATQQDFEYARQHWLTRHRGR